MKEGVRGAVLGSTSDLGKRGTQLWKPGPKWATVRQMLLPGGHLNPVNGMLPGLDQPLLESGDPVTGATKNMYRKENKQKHIAKQLA